MPHGLSITENHYYLTDVAMHQVFRFNKLKSDKIPELVLGEKFKPGIGDKFCKPTSTAALDNGDFFVADGYCNSRIIKFNNDGEKISEWGRSSFSGISSIIAPPGFFAIPHALTLVKDKNLICAADRENGRIQCFSAENGKFDSQYHSPIIGDRIFSVAYANNYLYVVNGPELREDVIEVKGFIIEMSTGQVVSKFGNFTDPHDIAVSEDGKEIFVADLTTLKVGSLSDSTAERLQDNKLNSKDNIYIDEDEVEGSGRGGEIREALESDNEDSNYSGSGNYGEDDEDDNVNVNKGGKFNLFEDRTNKAKPNKDSKNSIQHSSGDGTDQHIDNDDEDDGQIDRATDDHDDEDEFFIDNTTNSDPISPPFTDNEDIDNNEKKKDQESGVYGNRGFGIDVNPTQQVPNIENSPGHENTGAEGIEVLIMNTKNEDRPTSFFAQPGILAAVIGGAVVGLLCAILVVMFIVYRMRKKDEGSYALDEPKRSPTANSYAKNANNREFYA
ncbi:unnamed protein product [Diamesa serratosioi]